MKINKLAVARRSGIPASGRTNGWSLLVPARCHPGSSSPHLRPLTRLISFSNVQGGKTTFSCTNTINYAFFCTQAQVFLQALCPSFILVVCLVSFVFPVYPNIKTNNLPCMRIIWLRLYLRRPYTSGKFSFAHMSPIYIRLCTNGRSSRRHLSLDRRRWRPCYRSPFGQRPPWPAVQWHLCRSTGVASGDR